MNPRIAIAVVAVLTGCLVLAAFAAKGPLDSFSNLLVNCQVGVKNAGDHIAACQFRNTGREVTSGCVKVHVTRPPLEGYEGTPAGEEQTFVSDVLCSGDVQPDQETEPNQLAFVGTDAQTVAESCVRRVEDEDVFQCQFKIEEVSSPAAE